MGISLTRNESQKAVSGGGPVETPYEVAYVRDSRCVRQVDERRHCGVLWGTGLDRGDGRWLQSARGVRARGRVRRTCIRGYSVSRTTPPRGHLAGRPSRSLSLPLKRELVVHAPASRKTRRRRCKTSAHSGITGLSIEFMQPYRPGIHTPRGRGIWATNQDPLHSRPF